MPLVPFLFTDTLPVYSVESDSIPSFESVAPCQTAADFQNILAWSIDRAGIEGKWHRLFDDADDFTLSVYENHIQGDRGVFHPISLLRFGRKHKNHALIAG